MQNNSRWHYLETAEQVAEAACQQILNAATSAISERGKFKLVLAGGGTPEKVYRLLAESNADWANWHIYYGDERCLPADHQDRNSLMASRVLLDKVAIPANQIFTMPAELGPEVAAESYRLDRRQGRNLRYGVAGHGRGRPYRQPVSRPSASAG